MSVEYRTLDANLESCSTIRERIAKIDAIIAELETTALKSVATGNIASYRIDTGQSVQQVEYASTKSVTDTIMAYEKIRTRLVNKLIGHKFKQVDGRNLNRGFC